MVVDGMEKKKNIESILPQTIESYQLPPKLIEQLQMARSGEPFSLCINEYLADGELYYEAVLQTVDPETSGYAETSVTVSIPQEVFNYYRWQAINEEKEALQPGAIIRDIQERLMAGSPVTVHIGGRSGSGKSTIVREIQKQLGSLDISSCVLSTDDYHRGNAWLACYNNGEPWTKWDDPIVYATHTMASDLARLRAGWCIDRREIDWSIVEPYCAGIIEPADVIIIEGIYARSPDITTPHDLSYEMTTPLATCIGRRLLRDLRERPEFADPAKSLSYMLREAEPAYRKQATH